MSSLPDLDIAVPPLEFRVDNALVRLVELVRQRHKIGDSEIVLYIASAEIEWNCYRSPRFHVVASDEEKVFTKIRAEIAKMKAFVLSGATHLFTKVC